jgi:plasmid stabilization system protein ParE
LRLKRYVSEAATEVDEQFEYYRTLDADVASRFVDGVESAVDFVCRTPFAGPPVGNGYRARVLGPPFGYRVVYKLREDVVVVAAVWADRRNPDVLLERLANIEWRGE